MEQNACLREAGTKTFATLITKVFQLEPFQSRPNLMGLSYFYKTQFAILIIIHLWVDFPSHLISSYFPIPILYAFISPKHG